MKENEKRKGRKEKNDEGVKKAEKNNWRGTWHVFIDYRGY